ncbi:MAG: hypothetical protein E7638_06520 [Ruminococcaceae bacterium]|nr:hypothetical protein [Oscillospiraceae bacterium]
MEKTEGVSDRAYELFRESEYEIKVSKFLTPKERLIVRNTLVSSVGKNADRCFFFGGCRGTERCAAVFLPEWLYESADFEGCPRDEAEREAFFTSCLSSDQALREDIPITPISITGSGFKTLGHRDFMGSILSLGIERNMVGDILVTSEHEALVFVMDGIADYILSELVKIGRDGVKCKRAEVSPEYEAERAYEELTIHVSSMRLDGIVNQLTGEGRASAAEFILGGLVDLNYFTASNVSAEVKPGDIVSVRGFGKFIIDSPDGTTRSGRLRVKCKKYI